MVLWSLQNHFNNQLFSLVMLMLLRFKLMQAQIAAILILSTPYGISTESRGMLFIIQY